MEDEEGVMSANTSVVATIDLITENDLLQTENEGENEVVDYVVIEEPFRNDGTEEDIVVSVVERKTRKRKRKKKLKASVDECRISWRKKCYVCGILLSHSRKTLLSDPDNLVHKTWRKNVAETLCQLMHLDSEDDYFEKYFENGEYCWECDERIRNAHYIEQSLSKLWENLENIRKKIENDLLMNARKYPLFESRDSSEVALKIQDSTNTTVEFTFKEMIFLISEKINQWHSDQVVTSPKTKNAAQDSQGSGFGDWTDSTSQPEDDGGSVNIFNNSYLSSKLLECNSSCDGERTSRTLRAICPNADCKKVFRRHDHLRVHIKREHEGSETPYECTVPGCGMAFPSRDSYRSHVSTHEKYPHSCDQCERKFPTSHTLTKHKNSQHQTSRNNAMNRFPCEECGAGLEDEATLKEHVLLHQTMAPFQCVICSTAFSDTVRLRKHVKVSHEWSYEMHPCPVCATIFRRQKYLTEHMKLHTNSNLPMCEHCGKRFLSKSKLNAHLVTHKKYQEGQSNHVCVQCGKSYPYLKALVRHQKSHSESKNYTCKFCDKRFYEKNALQRHEVVHAVVKPFVCEQCGSNFKSKHLLHQHYRCHTKAKKGKKYKSAKRSDQPTLVVADDASLKEEPKEKECEIECEQVAGQPQLFLQTFAFENGNPGTITSETMAPGTYQIEVEIPSTQMSSSQSYFYVSQ